MFRISFPFFLIVLGYGKLFSQQPSPGPGTPTCSFSEIYREDGWTVPGVAGAKVKGQRARFSNIPGVSVTVLIPVESESTVTGIWCPPDHAGRLEIEERPIGILNLWFFVFEGRVFAYGISYGKEVIQNGTRVPIGSSLAAMFYDVDGSGHFKVRKWSRYPFMPDFVPDWVKKDVSATSVK